MKQYEKRNHVAQDAAGNYYSRHVSALTTEALHAKSDIAGELAHRDMEIDRLRSELRECAAQTPSARQGTKISPMSGEIMETLRSVRSLAMAQAVLSRIPECGKFAHIAQDLDWAISMLEVENMEYDS